MADFFDSVKDGLKSFGKTVSDTAEIVALKAEETVEVQKLKAKICGLKRDNNKDYQTIGKMVYEKFADEDVVDEAYADLCATIFKRKESIAEYKEEIEKIRE